MENLVNGENTLGQLLYPLISFSVKEGKGLISGESYMDDSSEFYGIIMDWIREFNEEYPDTKFELIIKLNYFNTRTSKMLFDLLILISELYQDNKDNFAVIWFYPPTDPDLLDDILDMSSDSGMEIQTFEMEE